MAKESLLLKLRKTHLLSQGELAQRLNVSRPTYVSIERGQKELTLSQAQILSSVYSIPVEAIRTGRVVVELVDKDIVTTTLPTKEGVFFFNVWNQAKGEEVVFLQTPTLDPSKPVLVRVHSECMTGDVFHSQRCDCGEQKDRSLKMISQSRNGLFIYLRQEGRGIGLHEKIKSYILQEKGYDTHEANILLGHKPDYREYSWAKKVFDHLNIQEIKLITNNPSKVSEISRLGIKVAERIPLVIESNHHNRHYFETKKQKFKHFFGKEESNYFYQFSYVTSPEQVEDIGIFMSDLKKDPLLKICMGVYADHHVLNNEFELKKIESIFKTAEHFESFVPILHLSFKFSPDYNADIAKLRKMLPFVKYVQLNDLEEKYTETLSYANKFFLVDIPLSDESFDVIEDPEFVNQVLKHKAFVLLDNSHGKGKQESKTKLMDKINRLLSKGINDIAIYGGFGPNNLSLYFDLKETYKINFSIDAESSLKTDDRLDTVKVKNYLAKLIKYSHENKS